MSRTAAPGRDLTGYLDEDGQLRLCVARLGQALADMLGAAPGPATAAKFRELSGLAQEVSDLCAERARQVDHIDAP